MRRALKPVLFDDEELEDNRKVRDPVAPAKASPSAKRKKLTRRTVDGFEVHSFKTLIAEMAFDRGDGHAHEELLSAQKRRGDQTGRNARRCDPVSYSRVRTTRCVPSKRKLVFAVTARINGRY